MSDAEKLAFKAKVKGICTQLIGQRIANAQAAMQQAQDSANNEEKSSAGDKYETARAMGQADRDMNARQLAEALKYQDTLKNVDVSAIHQTAGKGSVIRLNGQLFFIAVGLGAVLVDGKPVTVISFQSPLFEQLKNRKQGDTIQFQGRQQSLEDVF